MPLAGLFQHLAQLEHGQLVGDVGEEADDGVARALDALLGSEGAIQV